ncbi:hypothetical protein [uncultured Muribaculum sp.]|uniref:hypothetical protein n=1 Tax=uncultured Muribaculum sp. TaxID=1918613 RepID=UPI0025E48643|nr:hypothetical protein [uncultured Muribaculum sp.]
MKSYHTITHMLAVATLILASGSVAAQNMPYTVHEVSGPVKITVNGGTKGAEKGMGVKGSDNVIIADGGEIQILHKPMHKIYVWNTPGTISVNSLIINAKNLAADNSGAFNKFTTFSKRGASEGQPVYSTAGRTTRSMAKFDPDARNMQIDPDSLAAIISPRIINGSFSEEECPVSFTHMTDEIRGGATFTMANTLSYPVYFNILKVNKSGVVPKVEISELGQPTGNYVVRPGQTLMRGQQRGLAAGEKHVVIITQCFFDIDKLLESIDAHMENAQSVQEGNTDRMLPVFVGTL